MKKAPETMHEVSVMALGKQDTTVAYSASARRLRCRPHAFTDQEEGGHRMSGAEHHLD